MATPVPVPALPRDLQESYAALARDLQGVFGSRLHAVLAYGPALRTPGTPRGRMPPVHGDALALVDRVGFDDLTACSTHAAAWDRLRLHMPLLLGRDEFQRSLDAFPLEYDDIIAHHVVLVGASPLEGLAVAQDDLRRACEGRAKGHLVHLREGYLEAGARPQLVAALIVASAQPFSSLLGNFARLQARPSATSQQRAAAAAAVTGISMTSVSRVLALEADPMLSNDEAMSLYPAYLSAVEQLVAWVDGWSRSQQA
jgi:hypothetical protein